MADGDIWLLESYPVGDTYADGLGRVETTGPNSRLVFYVARIKDDGTMDNEIVQRVVIPTDALIAAAAKLATMPTIAVALTEAIIRERPSVLQ